MNSVFNKKLATVSTVANFFLDVLKNKKKAALNRFFKMNRMRSSSSKLELGNQRLITTSVGRIEVIKQPSPLTD